LASNTITFIPDFIKICQLKGSVWLSVMPTHTHIYMHVGKEPSLYVVAALMLLQASDHVGNVAAETGIMCSRKDIIWHTHEIVFLYRRSPVLAGNTFQDQLRLRETEDITERCI